MIRTPMTDQIPACVKCGAEHVTPHGHQACTGHKDLEDGSLVPCKNAPVTGSRVCRFHGAARGTGARAKADKRAAEARAEVVLRRGLAEAYGTRVPDVDPAEAMLAAVSWKHAEVLALRAKVAELDDTDRVWGTTKEKTGGLDSAGTTQEAKPNLWWQMLRTAEEQLVKFAAAARAAGCDERRVQLAEAQAGVVVGVIQAILDGLYQHLLAAGMTAGVLEQAWAAAVAEIVPRELRAAALGGTA